MIEDACTAMDTVYFRILRHRDPHEGLNDRGAMRICIPFVIQMPRFTLLILNEGNAQVSQQGDDVSV